MPASTRSARRHHSQRLTDRQLLALLLFGVNLPIFFAATSALARGWQPLSDNGYIVVRARDVLTAHHPLIGLASSASEVFGEPVNHPGPIFFDLLALPIKVLGPWVGTAGGMMLINMAAVSLAVLAAYRWGGREAVAAVALAAAGLEWTLGSELLFDVWQPNAMVLPAFAFLVVAAGLANGRLMMAPWAFGLGSLMVQAHVGHAPLVAEIGIAALALGAWTITRVRERIDWRRPVVATLAVTLICWIQPLIEQFTGKGPGNLSTLIGNVLNSDAPTIGFSAGFRLTAEAMVQHPWFTRSSYTDAIPSYADPHGPQLAVVSLPVGVCSLAVIVVVLLALAVTAWRRNDRQRTVVGLLSAIAVLGVVVAIAVTPINTLGLAPHQMRWAWSVAAFATAFVIFAIVRHVPDAWRAQASVALATGVAVVSLANLQVHATNAGPPVFNDPYLENARALVNQLDALRGRGTVLVDHSGLRFGEPYSGLVFAQLQDLGIPFVVEEGGLVRQLGERRRNDGDATVRLLQVEGSDAVDPPAGMERIAFVEDGARSVALLIEPID